MNPVHGAYGEFFLEYSLMAEYKLLAKQKLPGVFVVPSGRTPLCWNGVIFVRQGLYQGGVFKLAIFIPHDFPDSSCPKLVFDPPVYHPLANPDTGELDVHRAFSKWRRNVNHIWQVLMYARRVFHKVETDSPLNPHAAKLYTTDVDQFKAKVEECIEGCLERAVVQPHNPDQTSCGLSSSSSDDPMAICFSHMDPMQLKQAKDAMASFRLTGRFERTPLEVCNRMLSEQSASQDSIDNTMLSLDSSNSRTRQASRKRQPRRLSRRERSASHNNAIIFSVGRI